MDNKDNSKSTFTQTIRGIASFAIPKSQDASTNRRGWSVTSDVETPSASLFQSIAGVGSLSVGGASMVRERQMRRYHSGEYVLIHMNSVNSSVANQNLVNRYGFPVGKGGAPEEQRGPYAHVIAKIDRSHFREDAVYYTVKRVDTGELFRADGEDLILITSEKAISLVKKAAKKFADAKEAAEVKGEVTYDMSSSEKKSLRCNHPFILSIRRLYLKTIELSSSCYISFINSANDFLRGKTPFFCSFRLTGTNFLVCCSIWFAFVDQVILSFNDDASIEEKLDIVTCFVWFVLVSEILMEVFILPGGYKFMLQSELAYTPMITRYINTFHLAFESFSLLIFLPTIVTILNPSIVQEEPLSFTLQHASIIAVLGPTKLEAYYGRIYFALLRFRVFGLLRHWKNWINSNTIKNPDRKASYKLLDFSTNKEKHYYPTVLKEQLEKLNSNYSCSELEGYPDNIDNQILDANAEKEAKFKERQLVNATSIGTALMVINSHRAMILSVIVAGVIPLLLMVNIFVNDSGTDMVQFLQDTNLVVSEAQGNNTDCLYLRDTIISWLKDFNVVPLSNSSNPFVYVLWLQVLPIRCDFQVSNDGIVTSDLCLLDDFPLMNQNQTCHIWSNSDGNTPNSQLANRANIYVSSITRSSATNNVNNVTFSIKAAFNNQKTMQQVNFHSFLLQLSLFFFLLIGLEILRLDAGRLVLDPFRRMLSIVSRYSKNPLAPPPSERRYGEDSDDEADDQNESKPKSQDAQLGKFETQQLINAITKITDLLRKCWGVAGAGIISSNLARQADGTTAELNPCVAGTRVYGIFAFCGVCNFDYVLRKLGPDILVLINNIANVLHSEIYRWGFGQSGQCNKNLGQCFLLVFRIGAEKEVQERKKKATEVIFSTSGAEKKTSVVHELRTSKRLSKQAEAAVQLYSLPGIQQFADRSVLGLLKCYAGLHRNTQLIKWKNDPRLATDIGNYTVDMIYGMHAGWAVEGAVGSEYKIDATYLSPHVNMSSRMMSACKQYGVSILLSQAIEELMSEPARELLRHIDTVTVKGSSVPQRIYTYDMRQKGINFFLFDKSPEQADLDSERYTPLVWLIDQDLTNMRQHVTPDFQEEFQKGVKNYLSGNWSTAHRHLQKADKIMVQNVLDMGYFMEEIETLREACLENGEDLEAKLRNEIGDGPSRNIMAYIQKHNKIPPKNWKGFRALTSK